MKRWPILAALLTLAVLPQAAAAQAQGAAPPYNLDDVLTLLQAGHTGRAIVNVVSGNCVSFRVETHAADLRKAGADDAFLQALEKVCYKAPPRAAPQPPAQRERGYVNIVGELPPGWMRRVNALAPNTNREIDMTPGWRNFVTVSAPGWCPASTEITVQARERKEWRPVLTPRPWVGECPETR